VSCPTGLAYNFATVARSWGSLSGILAGFAFAATIQTLTRPTRSKDRDAHVVEGLVAAFLALLLAAMLYAVLSGENQTAFVHGRGTTEEYYAGAALGFGALILLYAVVVMIDARGLTTAASRARVCVGLLIPALVTLQVTLGGEDSLFGETATSALSGRGCSRAAYNTYVQWGIDAPSLAVLAFSFVAWRLVRKPKKRPILEAARSSIPYVALVLVLAAVVAFSTLSEFEDDFRLPHWSLYLIAWSIAAFAGLASLVTLAAPASAEISGDPDQVVASLRLLRQASEEGLIPAVELRERQRALLDRL
jgi:hypothetical protein